MSFIHGNVLNLYISYKLDTWSKDLKTDFMLGIGFDSGSQFSWVAGRR